MSQPKRYNLRLPQITYGMEESQDGEYVYHSDYAALVQQGIRDHGDWRSKLNFLEADYKAEIARLTAENERLRKAGDELLGDYLKTGIIFQITVDDWNAAKEGRDAK